MANSWYDFEQDLKNWHQHLGYEILHQAANGKGDGGIDTLARFANKTEAFDVLIQCKKWKNPVGPDVVRELLGSIQDYKLNVLSKNRVATTSQIRGAIFTTSYFTEEASQLANRHAVELFDGEAWSQLVPKLKAKS